MKQNKTGKIAMGGICTALAVIFMFGASFVPGIELTLFLISSLFTAVMVIEAGAAGGLSVFAAASLLGLILIPNKLALIPYVFCFSPDMLLIDTNALSVAVIAATSFVGIFGVSSALEGYLLTDMGVVDRILLIAGGLMMIVPGTFTDLAGLGLIAAGIALQAVKRRAKAA